MGNLRNTTVLLFSMLIVFLLAACGGTEQSTPTAEPTPEPSATPEEVEAQPESDPVWAQLQDRGELVVGVSADYPPFEYYDENFQLDGYDVALIREIGRRLDLDVRLQDQVFAGLTGALQLGQIDVAISAISITPEREGEVDFSNVYYVGQDAIVGHPDKTYNIETVEDLAAYKIGVQKGSVYEDWIRDDLIDANLMPEDNLFVYANIGEAFDDLLDDKLDVIVLDQRPAEIAESSEQVVIVAQGLNRQRYAIAVPSGAFRLQQAINQTLTELNNEGFLVDLAQQYLNIEEEDVLPVEPEQPVEPVPPSAECVDGMAYVADLSMDDNNMANPPQLLPGQPFRKGWRLENIGTCTWDSSYALVYTSGNSPLASMSGSPVFVQGRVQPGGIYDFWADLTAPVVPGTYQGFWSMRSGGGQLFGQRVWAGITVVPPAVPGPTQTPAPFINFTVDRTSIQQGECATFTWDVENIQAVWFYPDGADYRSYPVNGQGSSRQCPAQTTTYNLRVQLTDGSVVTRQITVYVEQTAGKPSIDRFTVSPSAIGVGQCVTIRWQISGEVTNVVIGRNEVTLWNQAPLSGNLQDCPPTGVATYYLETSGPGGSSRVQQNVNVTSPTAAPTALPVTATPAANRPVIDSFSVAPTQAVTGQCIALSWNVVNAPDLVQITRNDLAIVSPAGAQGSGQDCSLFEPGTFVYAIAASNEAGSAVPQQVTVTVAGDGPYPGP